MVGAMPPDSAYARAGGNGGASQKIIIKKKVLIPKIKIIF
jgi:hypothetical protein